MNISRKKKAKVTAKEYFGLLPEGVKITDILPKKHIKALKVILLGLNWVKIGLRGGRGALKSALAYVASILLTMHGDGDVLVLCKDMERCRSALELFKWLFERFGLGKENGWRIVMSPNIRLVYRNQDWDKGVEHTIHIVQMTNESLMERFHKDKAVTVIVAEDLQDVAKAKRVVHHQIDHAVNPRRAIMLYNKAEIEQEGLLDWFGKHTFGIQEFHLTYKDVPQEWLGKSFFVHAKELRRFRKDVYESYYIG